MKKPKRGTPWSYFWILEEANIKDNGEIKWTQDLFIKNKNNGINYVIFKIYILWGGGGGGIINPQIFSNIWKILLSQSNLKSIFFEKHSF